jgi:hypothetical protein
VVGGEGDATMASGYNVPGVMLDMTPQEYIGYLERQRVGLLEELKKSLEVVAKASSVHVAGASGYHYCLCCQDESQMIPQTERIHHAEDCQVLWLRRHGLNG